MVIVDFKKFYEIYNIYKLYLIKFFVCSFPPSGNGRLDLWNLNQDTEVPAASVVIDGAPALNRVSWTPSGLHVTIGDDSGKIYVYDVAEHLATPRMDEWTKFTATLNDLKMNQADDFESIENKKTPIPPPISSVSGPESLISNKSFV